MREAIAKALHEALDENENAFIMGEDIGEYGGAYAVTKGMLEEYGPERIRDTPISEAVVVGAGTGAALAGLKPIVEIMSINFTLVAIDQIVNHAAKLRYLSDGQLKVPMILRTVTGGGGSLGATHSQSFENWYASVPGLKVVTPSTPYDALGLFRTAMKDDNPISDGGNVSGATTNVLSFSPVQESDSGSYVLEFTDAAKATTMSAGYTLAVLPAGSLPVAGLLGLLALAGAVVIGTVVAMQRRRN